MSPHLILILMLSSVALLLVLFFAIRKRNKKTAATTAAVTEKSSEQTPLPLEKAIKSDSVPAADLVAATASAELDLDLSSLDLSGFSIPTQPNEANEPNEPSLQDIIDLVSRYRFFQGKNLETFSSLLHANNLNGIEVMIQEKFEAQKKENAELFAKEVTTKLISAVIP